MLKLDTHTAFRGASLVGRQFNRLTVVGYAGKDSNAQVYWKCRCDCGNMATVGSVHLKQDNTKSCGCLSREMRKQCMPFEKKEMIFWSKVKKLSSGCWEWIGTLTPQGYGHFSYNRGGVLAHRFSWFLHRGSWPTKPYVCHKCDNRKCVRPGHLFEGTAYDNNHDAIDKGRMRHWGRPKISPKEVIGIRKLYGSGKFTYISLGEHLGLPTTQIFSALNKWKTLPLYEQA